ncbi:hypothetical protein MWH25_08660 [Natroniella acetigena]|uniref:hypothetical protein n=1 Tax=Natroniella acetigena TaxID=52004 RepID=UPI00200A9ED6|nr:hypothetical protein [Natroniella acetigena]MCK8827810.1 hypothetical protein [Natroniella acetigena]
MGFGDWLGNKIIEGFEEAEEKLDNLERTINDPVGSAEKNRFNNDFCDLIKIT